MDDTAQNKETTTLRNAGGYMLKDTDRREKRAGFPMISVFIPNGTSHDSGVGWMDVVPEVPVRRMRISFAFVSARVHPLGEDLNRFLETGSADQKPEQGRRRATTPNKDRYLVLTAWRHRNMNAILLQQHLRSTTGTMVSTQTVRNQLHGAGLYARRPMSRFSVHPDNRRIFIWRYRGSRNNPAFVHESVRFGGGGVLVYVGISIDGRTDLYTIRDGPLTARRYRDEILRPIVVPYAAAIGDDFILMDDNCRPHRANLVEDFLFEKGIVRMEWPACSPDMNPIEHVWDALGRRVAGRHPPNSPRTGKSSSGRVAQNTPTRD
ncbi:transposable element Tcb2 transposase [Trichonephila clavipes]|nr:transposable element Tcb2 transposase [Trichonephila clavipes]